MQPFFVSSFLTLFLLFSENLFCLIEKLILCVKEVTGASSIFLFLSIMQTFFVSFFSHFSYYSLRACFVLLKNSFYVSKWLPVYRVYLFLSFYHADFLCIFFLTLFLLFSENLFCLNIKLILYVEEISSFILIMQFYTINICFIVTY